MRCSDDFYLRPASAQDHTDPPCIHHSTAALPIDSVLQPYSTDKPIAGHNTISSAHQHRTPPAKTRHVVAHSGRDALESAREDPAASIPDEPAAECASGADCRTRARGQAQHAHAHRAAGDPGSQRTVLPLSWKDVRPSLPPSHSNATRTHIDFCSFGALRFLQESQPVVLSELEQKQTAITSDLEALQKKQKVRPPSPLRPHSDQVWLTQRPRTYSTSKNNAKTHRPTSKTSFPASTVSSNKKPDPTSPQPTMYPYRHPEQVASHRPIG